MSFIAWKKVCTPIEEGGLGVKDLQSFGDALFLKLVWAVISDYDKPWVQVCKAKYYPDVGCWRARSNTGASAMWRQILHKRNFFLDHVTWHLGDGLRVQALSQPWFLNWTIREHASRGDRHKQVGALYNYNMRQWEMHELERLFQPDQVSQIVAGSNIPNPNSSIQDRLIWNKAQSGNYSVKEGYKQLVQNLQGRNETQQQVQWAAIWKWRDVAPKVKIFIWRLLVGALPLAVQMNARITTFSPTCQRCGEENEYAMHCFFFCGTSRMVWFGSQLGIRVYELPLDLPTTVQAIAAGLDMEGKKLFAYTLWELWKERNKAVIEHARFDPQAVLTRVNGWLRVQENVLRQVPRGENEGQDRYICHAAGWQVLTDASWEISGRAGCAHVIYRNGKLSAIGFSHHNLHDAFQAEAVALKEAMTHMWECLRVPLQTKVQFFSDCNNLVTATNQGDTDDLPSWRAMEVVTNLIQSLHGIGNEATIHHVRREAVQPAHELANTARRSVVQYRGEPHMALVQGSSMHRDIDQRYFKMVQEAPP